MLWWQNWLACACPVKACCRIARANAAPDQGATDPGGCSAGGRVGNFKNGFLGRPLRAKGHEYRELAVSWADLTHNLWVAAPAGATRSSGASRLSPKPTPSAPLRPAGCLPPTRKKENQTTSQQSLHCACRAAAAFTAPLPRCQQATFCGQNPTFLARDGNTQGT